MESTAQSPIGIKSPGYIRHKRYYAESFPGTAILTLSIIQLLMAIAAITAQALGQNSGGGAESNIGAGIWCGIVFGLSGIFGIIAWKNPTFSTILVYKIFNILAMILPPVLQCAPRGHRAANTATLAAGCSTAADASSAAATAIAATKR